MVVRVMMVKRGMMDFHRDGVGVGGGL